MPMNNSLKSVRQKLSGFTLMELMVVIAVVAIMVTMGGASFRTSLERNRQRSAFNSVLDMVSFARSEAVIRALPVGACASPDGVACNGSNWEDGWLVFVDSGTGLGGTISDGVLNGSEELLQVGNASPDGITVRTANFPSASNVGFREDGRVTRSISGTFIVCNPQGAAEASGLVVEVSGQGRVTTDGNLDDVDEDDEGNALSCP